MDCSREERDLGDDAERSASERLRLPRTSRNWFWLRFRLRLFSKGEDGD
jgi:hypothetical protein